VTEPTTYRFDDWTLHVDSGELTRDGKTVRLTPQPLRILVELLRESGKVVPRERLVEVLWPKGVVDYDNGLNVAVRKLRIALGDESETPRYIETLPRVGYRFVGRLHADAPREQPGGIDATSITPHRSAGRWIWASLILAVAFAGLAWLIRPDTPPSRDTSAAESATAPLVARRTTSVRAYDAYLQGIYHRSRRDADSTQEAIASFETALREDPEYAEAWAGLADTYVGAGIGHGIPSARAFALARDAARRSVELDPGLAVTHASLGQVYMFYESDYAAAEREYNLARAANENYARLWHNLGMLRAFQGRPEEALAAVRRARELEPMTLLFNANHALVLYHARRFDDAIAHSRGLLAAQPRLHQARSTLIRAWVAKGDVAAAVAELALVPPVTSNLSDAALVHAHAGARELALAEIRRIREMGERGFGVGYDLAVAYAALGDLPNACNALELAWKDASPFLGWMRLDPRLDPLRTQECFRRIEAQLGKVPRVP
jgi:DNA-binding winged helix-turn-helix (wHTH) protein/tetratricopeptide (TPR) repeat protein